MRYVRAEKYMERWYVCVRESESLARNAHARMRYVRTSFRARKPALSVFFFFEQRMAPKDR
jgi:hypothetical protein